MSFEYPYVLFVLLAIPILIVIYILRNKYKEATAPSTYLWELTAKFLKRRNPLRKVEHLLSLIIQCLTIAAMAIAMAKPKITLKGQADNIVFVLDASGSMGIEKDGTTRFAKAKTQIGEIASKAKKGSTYSLVVSDSDSHVVCRKVNNLSRFQLYLDAVELTDDTATLDQSMSLAQEIISSGDGNVCYLATDQVNKEDQLKNVHLINVADDVPNYAITDLSYSFADGLFQIGFSGACYASADYFKTGKRMLTIDIELSMAGTDGKDITQNLGVKEQEITAETACQPIVFDTFVPELEKTALAELDQDNFRSVKATILGQNGEEIKDGFKGDNTYIVYNNNTSVETKACVVYGDSMNANASAYDVYYLQTLFSALSKSLHASLPKSISFSAYENNLDAVAQENYDIIIFDSCTPSVLPDCGAVWFIGAYEPDDGSMTFDKDTGIVFQGYNDIKSNEIVNEETGDVTYGGILEYANNDNDDLYKTLVRGTSKNRDIYISEFMRYTLSSNFTSVLNYDNRPMIFAGKNEKDQREVVFSFNLADSNLPLIYDFIPLVSNLVNYSNPKTMSKFNYAINDDMTLQYQPSTTKSITVKTPAGKEEPISLADSNGITNYPLTQIGTYEVTVTPTAGAVKKINVYVNFPKEESDSITRLSDVSAGKLSLAIRKDAVKGDGVFDSLLPMIIVCAVLFSLDWILYAHEQY